MKTALLILAAGTSSRMKTAKQLLPTAGKTLLGLSIETALKTENTNIFCVLGANFDPIKKSIEKYQINIIENLNFKDGLSSSISFGINNLEKDNYDAVLIILADQPNITSAYLNALISAFKIHPDHVICSKYDKKKGVPAIFPRKYFPDLLKLQGEKGAGNLLNNEIIKVKTIDFEVDLKDIDTPEDYKNYIK